MHFSRAFTLIELSIVLVIIGLLAAGILAGQDLIASAGVRSQIAQIEEYKTAVNSFRGKYGALPGDVRLAEAASFGFTTTGCTGDRGSRDGNGLIEGTSTNNRNQGMNEPGLFWNDLSSAGMIKEKFTTADCATTPTNVPSTQFDLYFPRGRLGESYVSVYTHPTTSMMFFQITGIHGFSLGLVNGSTTLRQSLTVRQAQMIDAKLDDGGPYGPVNVAYERGISIMASASANPDTATSCYNTATMAYSVGVNGGRGVNCALSLKLQ